jgi:cytochrome c oxidase subunit I
VMFGGAGFGFFAALLYWFPKMFGRTYNTRVATIAWFPMFVGFNMLYFSMLVLGAMGMPRRYYTHLPQFHTAHVVATIGSLIMVTGLALLLGNLVLALFKGGKSPANPWGGLTLEWTITSPPPTENFEHLPRVPERPYAFNPRQGHP